MTCAVAKIIAAGGHFDVPVRYRTFDTNGNPVAWKANLLSFNLHFDSTAVEFTGLRAESLFTESIQVLPDAARAEADVSVLGDDLDARTDRVLVAGFTDHDIAVNLGWPNQPVNTPLPLYVARFKVKSGFTGSAINFTANRTGSAIDQNVEFRFGSSSVDLTLPPTNPQLSIANASAVTEGDTALFVVTLNQPLDSEVTATFSTVSGSGSNGAQAAVDFEAQSGETIVFQPGETQQTIAVQTLTDTLNEATESFQIVLTDIVGADLAVAAAEGTIQNLPFATGDVDGDSDFDANDSFLIHLVQLAGTNEQIERSSGSSILPAAQIRTNVSLLAAAGDVDGDGDFDANDSFLTHLVMLSGTNEQIDRSSGSSSLTASQIRAAVAQLAPGGSNRAGNKMAAAARLFSSRGSDEVQPQDEGPVEPRVSSPPSALQAELNHSDAFADENVFRSWIDALGR